MTSGTFNYFYRVEFTLASYDLGELQAGSNVRREVVYKTVNVVNKPIWDGDPNIYYSYYPILQQLGEVTVSAGEYIPTFSVSSITLDDSIGTIGPRRKFSDLLERYTAIGQTVKVYVGESDNLDDKPNSWFQIGEGRIITWQTGYNSTPPTISFEIAPFKVSNRVMNLEISSEILGMSNAPTSALGKALPIVLSKRETGRTDVSTYPQITPIRITGDQLPTAEYACATHMYRVTKAALNSSGVIYVKRSWDDPSYPWGTVFISATPPDYRITSSSQYSLTEYGAKAYKLFPNNALAAEQDYIATGITFRCQGFGYSGRASKAYLSAFILRVDKLTYSVIEEMTSGQVALANYDTQNNLKAIFDVKISFDRPVVIPASDSTDYDFYFGWQATEVDQTGDLAIRKYVPGVATNYKFLVQGTGGGGSAANSQTAWRPYASTDANQPAYKLEVVTGTFTPHVETYTPDGFTYSKLSLTQSNPDSGQVTPDLDSLEIIVPMEGLCDYTTGSRISQPHLVLRVLSCEWAGDRWEDRNTIDTTTLSDKYNELFGPAPTSYRGRWLTGLFDSKVTYENVIKELARGTASRIGILNNGKMFMYPWGDTSDAQYNIPAADIIPLSLDARDDSNIINQAIISVDRVLKVGENQNEVEGYSLTVNYSAMSYISIVPMTRQSVSIYGYKNLQDNKFSVFGFHQNTPSVGTPGYLTGGTQEIFGTAIRSDNFSVDFLGEYYLTRYALSVQYVSFVVPWHRYKSIRMFDIVNFSHPAFPAFYGTDPEARVAGVEESSGSVYPASIANDGGELVRAQTYRGIVESISYVMAMEHAPAIRLTIQLLINQKFDPT